MPLESELMFFSFIFGNPDIKHHILIVIVIIRIQLLFDY